MTQINAARSQQNLETLHLNESFIFDQWTFQKHLIQIYNLNHNVFFYFDARLTFDLSKFQQNAIIQLTNIFSLYYEYK